MTSALNPRVFDFSRRLETCGQTTELIRDFAANQLFRSASVEELVLDSASYRRPARPEDLSFIDFSRPATTSTATRLPFLASQRLLLTHNESRFVRWPLDTDLASLGEFSDFHAAQTRETGSWITPFLEDFAFDFLEPPDANGITLEDIVAWVDSIFRSGVEYWNALLQCAGDAGYLQEGIRFLLIQEWGLAQSKRDALRAAAATGFFDIFPSDLHPRLDGDEMGDSVLGALARLCGVTRNGHAYWQFYLASSLARCNLLHAFAARPGCALRLTGAGYVARAEWLTFRHGVTGAAPRLDPSFDRMATDMPDWSVLSRDFRRVLEIARDRHGDWAVREIAAGVATAITLAEHARYDLREQLRWLSSLERYRQFAHMIDQRIRRELPNIDRETFLEPREMCSTTHVHDDHRLVVIQSGDMVFWGNLGMTLRLRPGEMVLVPQGRLHGSSIESDECLYHQPIIPDVWIESLLKTSDTWPDHRTRL